MTTRVATEAREELELVGAVTADAQRLVGEHLELLRSEVHETVDRVIGAGVSVAAGSGLVAAGGLLSVVAAAQLLHRATGLPQWACYGIAAGTAGAAGSALIRRGRSELAAVRVLPKTAEAVGETVSWVRDQLTVPAGQGGPPPTRTQSARKS